MWGQVGGLTLPAQTSSFGFGSCDSGSCVHKIDTTAYMESCSKHRTSRQRESRCSVQTVVALDSRSHASSNYVDSATHKKACCQESGCVRLSETVIEAGCRIQASFASLTLLKTNPETTQSQPDLYNLQNQPQILTCDISIRGALHLA